ncbi:Protein XRP2 [Armadillidium vulgare]|nr:Protein XRP2 [Armadillidium vulgare]
MGVCLCVGIVIASTWRSGSSFVYDLFDSHPDVYVHYEPLQPYGVQTFYQENITQNIFQKPVFCRTHLGETKN